MALRNARDVYTRRQEGVSIWVVPRRDITASSPDERTRSSTRRPTRSTGTRRSTTCPRMSSTCDRQRWSSTRLPSSAPLRARGSATTRWSRPAAGRVDQPRPADRGGHGPRQHRARPARSGPRAAHPRRRARAAPGRDRGRPGLPARRARVPQRPARRAAARRLRLSTMARLLVVLGLPVRAVRRAGRLSDETLSGVGGQGGQGGRLPPRPRQPLGAAPRRRHRRVPPPDAGGARRGSRPTSPSCSRTTRSSVAAAGAGAGVLPSSLWPAASAYVERVVAEATLTMPDGADVALPRRPRRHPLRAHGLPARRDAAPRPLPPRGDLVTPAGWLRPPPAATRPPGWTPRRCARDRRGARPRGAGHHHRGPRHPARRHGRRGRPARVAGRRSRRPTAAARPWTRSPAGVEHVARRSGWTAADVDAADARPGPPTGCQRRRARQAARRRHRPARARAAEVAPGPVHVGLTVRRVTLPAVRLRRHARDRAVRLHRVQGPVALQRLPRALRRVQGDLMTTPAHHDRPPAAPGPVPRADRVGGRAADRRRGRGHVRRARTTSPTSSRSSRGSTSPCAPRSTARTSAAPTRSAGPRRRRAGSASCASPRRGSRAALMSSWLNDAVRVGDTVQVMTPLGSFVCPTDAGRGPAPRRDRRRLGHHPGAVAAHHARWSRSPGRAPRWSSATGGPAR